MLCERHMHGNKELIDLLDLKLDAARQRPTKLTTELLHVGAKRTWHYITSIQVRAIIHITHTANSQPSSSPFGLIKTDEFSRKEISS